MDEIRFADPAFLLLLLLLPWMGWRQRRHGQRLRGSVRYPQVGDLRGLPAGPWAVARRALPVARFLAVACLVAALARPQSGERVVDVSAEGVDIMLILDVSGSMRARDLGPAGRLAVAKEVVARFIHGRHTDRIGMVVFAAESFTQCPLTLDYDVLLQFLEEIDIAHESWDGTAIGMALINASNRLRDAGGEGRRGRVAILLTDGVNNAGEIYPQTAAEAAAAVGVRVYTIGIGAPPQIRGRGVDFDEETLRSIAAATGGQYYHATSGEKLEEIYAEIGRLEKTEVTSQVHLEYSELYPLLLWPGFLALAGDFLLSRTRFRSLP